MIITICGSMKFHEDMERAREKLELLGHSVFMPIKVTRVDYWAEDGSLRIEAKKGLDLIGEHHRKIEKSDAILVVNCTKRDTPYYIGANTFIEIGFAHYLRKKISLLNPVPEQPYIIEELLATEPIVVHGDFRAIRY